MKRVYYKNRRLRLLIDGKILNTNVKSISHKRFDHQMLGESSRGARITVNGKLSIN